MSELRRHIPNFVSLSRLVMAAAFPLVSTTGRIWLCVLAALSDVLDGAIARRFDIDSPHGHIIDPVGDKAFVVTVFVVFIAEDAMYLWEVAAILLRDIAVVGSITVLLMQRRPEVIEATGSRLFGKMTTVLQFTVFAVVLVWEQSPLGLVLATGVISFVAGVDYLRYYYRKAESMRKQPA